LFKIIYVLLLCLVVLQLGLVGIKGT